MSNIQTFKRELARVFDDNLHTKQWHNYVDYAIMGLILISTVEVFLSTFSSIAERYGKYLMFIDHFTTYFFTVEVTLRIWCADEIDPKYKGLWGYIEGADTTRRTTLCLLSQFLGYADWEAYLAALAQRTDVESEAFAGEGLNIDDLQAGDRIEVTWLPNRRCVFCYEGNAHFLVTEAENAKLHVGDRFETACFLIGKPMYIDRLVRGDNPPTAYVAGSRNGLLTVRKL